MSDTALLIISRLLGLLGTGLLVGGSLGGALMAARRSRNARLQQPENRSAAKNGHWLATFTSHRRLTLIGSVLLLAHPLPLLGAAHRTGLGVMHLIVPFTAPRQTLSASLGVLALYLLLVVLASSLAMKRIGRRYWRALHYGAYPALILGLFHGVLAGDFSGRPVALAHPVKLTLALITGATCLCIAWRVAVRRRAVPINAANPQVPKSLRRAA